MPFSVGEVEQIYNSVLDYHEQEQPLYQTLEDKPFLRDLMADVQTFPGGRDYITGQVKGDPTTEFVGYEADEKVEYTRPEGVKQYKYPWKEMHAGIEVVLTMLKKNGISVVDTAKGDNTVSHSKSERFRLVDILRDNIKDMNEGIENSLNDMAWRDGTQSSKLVAGLMSMVVTTPTTGTCGGIDRGLNSFWRNRVYTGLSASGTNRTLILRLSSEVRQLRRYGGRPNKAYCGSDFLGALEQELVQSGYSSMAGWSKKETGDITVAPIRIRGVGEFMYDPKLDGLGYAKRCYILDMDKIKWRPMDGEHMKKHTPARPHDRYAIYRAVTETAGMICKQMNCHGVYELV